MQKYGQRSIPVLLRKHPALAAVLRLGFLSASSLSPRRWALQLALSPIVYFPLRWLTRLMLRRYVPGILFSYLFWSSRTRGYLQARKREAC